MHPPATLYGRTAEQQVIAGVLARSREGRSGMVVIRGEAGIGKTALLERAAWEAGDMMVLRGSEVETEAELPFAGLHLILRTALGRLGDLPAPQANALRGAFALPGAARRGADATLGSPASRTVVACRRRSRFQTAGGAPAI